MWGWDDGPNGWGWFWMIFMMAIVWVPLLLAGLWIASQMGRTTSQSPAPPPPSEHHPDARELARQAYARGELDRERFLKVMEDLDQTEHAPRGD